MEQNLGGFICACHDRETFAVSIGAGISVGPSNVECFAKI